MRGVAHIAVVAAVAMTTAVTTSPSAVQAVGFVAAPVTIANELAGQVAIDYLARSIGQPPTTRSGTDRSTRPATTRDLRVTATAPSAAPGVTHVYVQQTQGGLDIVGADASVAVDGLEVVYAPSRLLPAEEPDRAQSAQPDLTGSDAAVAAARALNVTPTAPFTVLDGPSGSDRSQQLSDGGIANDPIIARLVWIRDGKVVRLAWELEIDMAGSADWWLIHIDAANSDEIGRINYNIGHRFVGAPRQNQPPNMLAFPAIEATGPFARSPLMQLVDDGSSYNVFPLPIESPSHAPTGGDGRSIVTNPADDIASPFGWHDTDGDLDPDFTDTRGNNVDAHTDRNDDDVPDPGSRPDGGAGLDFDFALDLGMAPTANTDAAVTNLFYANNMVHDLLYAHGFDEASGNFQTNNYGRGGLGGDAVQAQAQDGGSTNNADFATLPDGTAPRMQMYNWTGPSPDRDGAFDTGIVLHEYAHGLSTRLTGGPATTACLNRREQGGEGWSDFVALVATMRPGDTREQPRGIGTYALGEPITGTGIRTHPYSSDPSIPVADGLDPRTYANIATASIPHGVGSIWAAMLWEVTWDLVDEYGFDPDVVRGDGGNNLALKLVIEGLKLQPCEPGFTDARDAILQADQNLTGGANECLLWRAFARRGLGFSADQANPNVTNDGTEAFDLPPFCPLGLTKTASASVVDAGAQITYTITIENNTLDTETDIEVTDVLDPRLTYVAGSGTCGGTLTGTTLTFAIASLAPGERRACSFRAATDVEAPPTVVAFADDFENGTAQWVSTHDGAIVTDWAIVTGEGRAGSDAMFVNDDAAVGNRYLTMRTPVTVPAGAELVFWHRHDLEANYDGGVVEISTDGGASWHDLGPHMVTNGYNDSISTVDSSPIAGRPAFSGFRDGFAETVVDLNSFGGQSALVRFRLATDPSVIETGWWVDDLRIGTANRVPNTASVTSTSAGLHTASVTVEVNGDEPDPDPDPKPDPDPDPDPKPDPEPGVDAAWTSVSPTRILDTRNGPIRPADSTLTLEVAGRAGIPNDATAVIVNITAVRPDASGFATVFPCNGARPGTSSLNFTAGVNLGNELIAAIDDTGDVCVFVSAATHLTADVVGYVNEGAPVQPLLPTRLLDTRPGGPTLDGRFSGAGPIEGGTQIELDVAGRGGARADATAVVVNVTAIRAEAAGFVTVSPCSSPRPTASSLNVRPGANRANELVAQLNGEGKLCLFASTTMHLAVDLVGELAEPDAVLPVGPVRLMDTRPTGTTEDGRFVGAGALPARTTTRLDVAGRSGVPGDATSAVLNITAVQPGSAGFVTVWPCSQPRPEASSLNHTAGVNGANEIIAGLDTDGPFAGKVCVYNDRAVGLVVDVVGATTR